MGKKTLTKKSYKIVQFWFLLSFFFLFVLTGWLFYTSNIFGIRSAFYSIIDPLEHNYDCKKETDKQNDDLISDFDDEVKISEVSLVMVGDSLIHSALYADARTDSGYDFRPMLSELKPIVSNYDLAFYNQESILGGEELGLSSYPAFNSPYEVGDAFLDAGFNIVSLANNHTLDRGEEAILNSVSYWKSKNVMFHGSASSFEERNQIKVMQKNGIRYALLSYTDYTNDIPVPRGKEYLVNLYSEEQVKKDVEALQGKTDVIMVSMHFGEEYSQTVSDRQRQIANYLASLGVHIVIGHHPHVVEPTEMIGNTLVIYSLGNFISAQRGVDRLSGLMYSLNIIKEESKEGVKIYFKNQKASLIYTYSDTIGGYRRNFKLYPYRKLNDKLLLDAEMYYNRFMDIAVSNRQDVEKW